MSEATEPDRIADPTGSVPSRSGTTSEASISVESILQMIESTVQRSKSTALTAAGISRPPVL